MISTRYYSVFFSLVCLFACKEEKKEIEEKEIILAPKEVTLSPERQKGTDLLNKCISAHGGMSKWNSFEALEYNLNDKGKMVYQVTQLKDRRAYIKSKEYEVGFDGRVAWALPDANKVSGKSAAFYYNLDFYFIGVPFLLKDSGVVATYSGETTISGKTYESLKITFNSGVGLTPEDVYYLYIDPESFMLNILTYSISYFDKEDAKINSAKIYSEYQEIQGVKMPTKMENFEWSDGHIGKSKEHVRLFSDIKFLTEIPDERLFKIPDRAIIEKLSD